MKIHFLGIAGTLSAPLAIELQRLGHTISGSDQDKIYPPIGPLLENHNIPINTTTIDSTINLVIVGASYASFHRTLEEFETIKKLNIHYISTTQYLADNLCHSNSILVAGSYGKSTITALISHILLRAKYNPTFFFGGQLIDQKPSLSISDSNWSVIEADESINGLDEKAKFLYYPVKYLVLTSAQWEHKESYPTENDNYQSFSALIKNIPADGLLIYNQNDPLACKLAQYSAAPAIAYGNNFTHFDTKLFGEYNQENCHAAFTLCRQLGINEAIIKNAISTFPGLKRRLEIIAKSNNLTFIDDFAQSADRIAQAVNAIKNQFPHHQIKVFFEPHASFLQYQTSLTELGKAFENADEVVLSKIIFNPKISKTDRVTAINYQRIVGEKLIYLPQPEDIISHFQSTLGPNQVLIHFSSGGLEGLSILNKIISNSQKIKI